jgi:[acyl-carrier-protein] S-malonyltransferase
VRPIGPIANLQPDARLRTAPTIMRVAFLFPGQGSQRVGMGKELAANFAAARNAFEEADDALSFALSRLCFEGPEDELRLTANTQPAMLAVAIAAVRAFQGEFGATPEVAAGHSLGEYSALVAAGALDFPDALRAVRERGRLMQEAVPAGQGTMAAVVGLTLAKVREICESASQAGERVFPANLNSSDQIVVAGHVPAVRRAIAIAKESGAKMATELNVSAPFHCPLMEPARRGMERVLANLRVNTPSFAVIANVCAEANREPGRVVPLLLEQIVAPVRWEESMRTLAATDIGLSIEFGCGRVLAGLMRRIDGNMKVVACEDVKSLKAAGAALASAA